MSYKFTMYLFKFIYKFEYEKYLNEQIKDFIKFWFDLKKNLTTENKLPKMKIENLRKFSYHFQEMTETTTEMPPKTFSSEPLIH